MTVNMNDAYEGRHTKYTKSKAAVLPASQLAILATPMSKFGRLEGGS